MQTILTVGSEHKSFCLDLRNVVLVGLALGDRHTFVTVDKVGPIVNIPRTTRENELGHAVCGGSSE